MWVPSTDWRVHACVSFPPPHPAGCGPASGHMARGPLIRACPRPATLGTCAVGDMVAGWPLVVGGDAGGHVGGQLGARAPMGVGGDPLIAPPRAPGLSAGPATACQGPPGCLHGLWMSCSWAASGVKSQRPWAGPSPGLTSPHPSSPLQTFRGRGLHQVSALECLVGRGAQV